MTPLKFKSISTLPVLIVLMSVILFYGCQKDEGDITDAKYSLSGSASGGLVIPAVNTSATGSMIGSYDSRTNQLHYNFSWISLAEPATDSIIVYGSDEEGVNTNVIRTFAITTPGTSGSAIGDAALTDEEEQTLLSSEWYFVIGSNASYPEGEIRGHIIATRLN